MYLSESLKTPRFLSQYSEMFLFRYSKTSLTASSANRSAAKNAQGHVTNLKNLNAIIGKTGSFIEKIKSKETIFKTYVLSLHAVITSKKECYLRKQVLGLTRIITLMMITASDDDDNNGNDSKNDYVKCVYNQIQINYVKLYNPRVQYFIINIFPHDAPLFLLRQGTSQNKNNNE